MAGPGNAPRAAGAGSDPIERLMHGFEHRRMLAHAKVIVGTPDGHPILQAMIKRVRKVTGAPLEVGKDPISVFPSYELDTRLKELIEIHRALRRLSMSMKSSGANRVGPFSEQRSPPFNVSRQGPPLSGQDRRRL
jgi:hypothetical protein